MSNGKSVSLQVVMKKLGVLETRMRKLEAERSLGVVRLSDREMREIEKIHKEMVSGKEKRFRDIFHK